MKKNIIIFSNGTKGKSLLADTISLFFKNPLRIDSRIALKNHFAFNDASENTDLIIFENAQIRDLKRFIFNEEIKVDKMNNMPFFITPVKVFCLFNEQFDVAQIEKLGLSFTRRAIFINVDKSSFVENTLIQNLTLIA